MRKIDEKRVNETAELVSKLHLLDEKELMFVAGTVAALTIAKKLRKDKGTDNKVS